MLDTECASYLEIARHADIFCESELKVLKSVLEDTLNNPSTPFIVFDEKEGDNITGFIVFGRGPMTEYGWDIYWLVVDKAIHRKGNGKKLLKRVEEYICSKQKRAILRVETSSHPEYACAVDFYRKTGFSQTGSIENFYGGDDHLLIFSKSIVGMQ